MPNITASVAVNNAITAAKGLPSLIANLNAVQPGLAAQLETKPLLFSKSIYAPPIAYLLTLASTHYGLGWDDATSALVTGIILFVVSAAVRSVTRQPIAGVVSTPTGTPPAVPDVAPSKPAA